MPTQLDIKRRIRSVKNTQQITRAMKFVAAARLRRAQEKALAARPYAEVLQRVVRSVASRAPEGAHPLLARRPEKRVLLMVISGERGLAGAFNANVIRRALEFLRGHQSEQVELMTLGRKGRDALRKQRWKITGEYVDITAKAERRHAVEIAKRVGEMYQQEEVDAVYIVFNEFKSVLTQTLRLEKLLPIEPSSGPSSGPADAPPGGSSAGEAKKSGAEASEEHGGASTEDRAANEPPIDYLYEQPPGELFAALLPRYLEGQLFRALAESAASEHAARMTAMDSATNNAGELIDKLTLYMNKVRQAAITKEIIEVVSGAASAGS